MTSQHSHLPTLEINPDDICGFLQMIIRAGGGRVAYARVGGIGDVPCLVDNQLYEYLLWLHWDRERKQFVPAMLTDDSTRPITTVEEVVFRLPSLANAYLQAFNHPANRQRKAA